MPDAPSATIRVLIVDDIAETRENIKKLLQFEADISGIENLDPLLEAYAFSGDQRLLDLAKAAMADPEVEATLREWGEGKFITGHGVGASEHIRLPILLYPWTGEVKYRQASVNGFQYFAQEPPPFTGCRRYYRLQRRLVFVS